MPRTAVISGVGSGLGASLVRKFAAAGYQIGLLARSPGYIQELADELHHKGQTALPVPTDITSPTQVAHGFAQVRDQLGPIDLNDQSCRQRRLEGIPRFDPGGF